MCHACHATDITRWGRYIKRNSNLARMSYSITCSSKQQGKIINKQDKSVMLHLLANCSDVCQ